MKKIHVAFIMAIMLVLAACSAEAPGAKKESESTGGEGDLKIGFSISTLNNPFFVTLSDGAQAQAQADEMGAELIVIDAQDDAAKQASDVEDLIQQGVNLILINPTDSEAVVATVQSANDAGIPVITVDRSSEGGEVVSHIASDNKAGGVLAGEHMVSLLGESAKVVELEGIAGSSAARDRGAGFNEIAEGQLDVVAKQTANFNRAEGLTVMENILQANPDITGVFAHNDEMALGALEAVEAAGKEIKIVGFDATDDAVKSVEEGKLAGTVAQKPDLIGKKAVETAVQSLKGETVETSIPVELELIKK